jgi:hypothetical protein
LTTDATVLGPGSSTCRAWAAKLYLPGRERYFGCRHCHHLTYTSCQEHDKRVDALRNDPAALFAILDNPGPALDTRILLALRALR